MYCNVFLRLRNRVRSCRLRHKIKLYLCRFCKFYRSGTLNIYCKQNKCRKLHITANKIVNPRNHSVDKENLITGCFLQSFVFVSDGLLCIHNKKQYNTIVRSRIRYTDDEINSRAANSLRLIIFHNIAQPKCNCCFKHSQVVDFSSQIDFRQLS